MPNDRQKPGETPNSTGDYIEVGPRGGQVNKPRVITIDSEDGHLPPTSEAGNQWEPVSGRKR